MGGRSSTLESEVAIEVVLVPMTLGFASEAISREICVLLSKKSSQQSVGAGNAGVFEDVSAAVVFEMFDKVDFDAGRPGSLKSGFKFT